MSATIEQLVANWQQFYQVVFGINVDLSTVRIPKPPHRGLSLGIVAPISMQAIETQVRQVRHFATYDVPGKKMQWDTIAHDRDAGVHGPYAFWMQDGSSPDSKFIGLSVATLRERRATEGIQFCTIQEYCLLGLFQVIDLQNPQAAVKNDNPVLRTSNWRMDVGMDREATTVCVGSYDQSGASIRFSATYDPDEYTSFDKVKPDDTTRYFDIGTVGARRVYV